MTTSKGSDNLRDHVLSERYNVGSVLRWQLKDVKPLHRGVTRYVSPQGRLTALDRSCRQ